VSKRINACIEQHFRCLTYCAELFAGDVATFQACQEFCDSSFFTCVGVAMQDVNAQIDNLVALRTAIEMELAAATPSKVRLFDLLTQFSAQSVVLGSLVRINGDLAEELDGPEQAEPGAPPQAQIAVEQARSTPRKARKKRRRST
jgi:hypothetical protein